MSIELWTSKECAAFLKVKPRYFLDRVRPHPDFPKPYHYPTITGRSNPRWRADEVIQWLESQRQAA